MDMSIGCEAAARLCQYDPYGVLGLERETLADLVSLASAKTARNTLQRERKIVKQYRILASIYHPDKANFEQECTGVLAGIDAEQRFAAVEAAYHQLLHLPTMLRYLALVEGQPFSEVSR